MPFLGQLQISIKMAYTLSDLMQGLPEDRQLTLAVHFCKLGLPIWDAFATQKRARSYYDGVVGLHHVISETLPTRALALAQSALADPTYCARHEGTQLLGALKHEFVEPIVALQDDDWELPDAVRLVFYAHSNLVEHLAGKVTFPNGETALYVALNQAIDALESSGHMTFAQIQDGLRAFSGGQAPRDLPL
jgi:hypothetical protein